MKRCPTCQKEFADSMRFCQTDGTPLVEVAEKAPPPDPYKTVVGGMIKMDDDYLQIPEQNDPLKTMVGSPEPPKAAPPKADPPLPKPPTDPIINVPPKAESKPQEPAPAPKPMEPGLSPPKFGDLSPGSGASGNVSPSSPFNPPPPNNEPAPPKEAPASPFSKEPDKGESPFGKPSNAPISSPFDKPSGAPLPPPPPAPSSPPPYKDPEPMFGGQQPPAFNQSPFSQPQTPFGQSSEPANKPFQQDDWAPPPAPVAGWQDQGLGANTPFQPPVAGVGGENKILPIISLVLGILSLCCYVSPITGIAALVTGFLGMKNANNDPANYGGKTLAIVGMILGGLFFFVGIAYYIFVFLLGGLAMIQQ